MNSFPLWANIGLLVAAGAVTWVAGALLTRHVDAIASATRSTRALLGAVLLGGITSLPEAATVTTAAALGDGSFAVGNVLGSTSANLAILAAAAILVRGAPVLGETDREGVRRQASLVIVLLAITACAAVVGEPFDARVGLWTVGIVAVALVSFLLIRSDDTHPPPPASVPDVPATVRSKHLRPLVAAAAVILVAGYAAASAGTTIAEQTGLSGGFVGFSLLAVTTSLPELSTTVSALRIGRTGLAFGNILGTNLFNHVLLLPADIVGGEGPLFVTVDHVAVVAAMLGVVLLAVYLARLTAPPKLIAGRISIESVVILVLYAAGTALVYGIG